MVAGVDITATSLKCTPRAAPFKAWKVKADSIRKFNCGEKEGVSDKPSVDAQAEEASF